MRDRAIQIDVGALVIEIDSHGRVALSGFDHSRVERRAPDRVDAFFWIDIVRDKYGRPSRPGGMNHPAPHRDGVLQDFICDPKLLERMNPARGEREIDRAPADNIAFAW